MAGQRRLTPARLESGEDGTPRAGDFADIYFSTDGGAEETRHVFLDGTDLPARFGAAATAGTPARFCIGELGFGTGLNIACLMALWREAGVFGHLHIVSVEGFPLHKEDFDQMAHQTGARWPALAPFMAALARHYPPLQRGFHHLPVAPDVTLTLCFDDVLPALHDMTAQVDSWFLDGFSPSRNPDMWQPEVFREIARLSAPGARLATFTVARMVRDGLAGAGFETEKTPGFGRKRDMLRARLVSRKAAEPAAAPWFRQDHLPPLPAGTPVLIAGGGIAGAALANRLSRYGVKVTLLAPNGLADGASGNPAGLIMPRLDLGMTPASLFYESAFIDAIRGLDRLEVESGTTFLERGAALLSRSAQDSAKAQRILAEDLLPEGWLTPLTDQGVATKAASGPFGGAGYCHLFTPEGGVVRPAALTRALTGDVTILPLTLTAFDQNTDGSWNCTVEDPHGAESNLQSGCLILACGAASRLVLPELRAFSGSLGQVERFSTPGPAIALSAGHYIAPLDGEMIGGANYSPTHETGEVSWTLQRAAENIEALCRSFPGLEAESLVSNGGRASVRCVTPDRHPVAGPVPQTAQFCEAFAGLRTGCREEFARPPMQRGLFVLSGLGSRGLVSAPLLAEHLARQICGGPAILPQRTADLVHPARFLVRALKRREI